MRKRILIMATLAIIAVLASSLLIVSQATAFMQPTPQYVDYVFRLVMNATAPDARVITAVDNSSDPIIVVQGYYTPAAIVSANVTINDELYTYPDDFDYNFSFRFEFNNITGFGIMLVQETLYFNSIPGHPTLIGQTEEKATNYIAPYANFEFSGNFQVSGTKLFRSIEGEGVAMFGNSTGFVIYHAALVSGWPPGQWNYYRHIYH